MHSQTLQPTMIPDKRLIEQRFSKAAHTYEQQADIQHVVAEKLLAMLDDSLMQEPLSVLEIGCCTGLLTAKLVKRFPDMQHFTASDLVSSFQPYIEEKTRSLSGRSTFVAGDIEQLTFARKFDLIISSSTFHWIHDLPRLFNKLHDLLTPQGMLAYSIYGAENLKEIRTITGIGLPYQDFNSLLHTTEQQFTVIESDHNLETLWFSTPLATLQHLRQTGVNAIGTKAWTRKKLNLFSKEYAQRFKGDQGIRLTYHPMYFIAQPKG